jgi:hypothetical protein
MISSYSPTCGGRSVGIFRLRTKNQGYLVTEDKNKVEFALVEWNFLTGKERDEILKLV